MTYAKTEDGENGFANWNVRTMLQGGKMQEIANELETYNTHIAALQETRWKPLAP